MGPFSEPDARTDIKDGAGHEELAARRARFSRLTSAQARLTSRSISSGETSLKAFAHSIQDFEALAAVRVNAFPALTLRDGCCHNIHLILTTMPGHRRITLSTSVPAAAHRRREARCGSR